MYAKRLHFFLSGSVKTPVPDVGKVSGNGSRSGHHGADEMSASTAALAAFKVSVAGGSTAFAGLQDVGIHAQAHRAARFAPFESGFLENSIEAFLLGGLLHGLRA